MRVARLAQVARIALELLALVAIGLVLMQAAARPAFGEQRGAAAKLPSCAVGSPLQYTILNASSSTDCTTTGGGTTEARCCCLNGSWGACGGSSGSITVGDGTTTVNPASTLTFDPTYFDVTDEGSEEAGITFVGSTGGGTYIGTRASLLNEPATPNAQDCEFDGNACDWTWQSATWTESAVEPNLQRGASEFYYDFDTWPGWVLMQGDNTSATQKYLSRSWSADTDATWMIHLLGSNFGAATNERRLQFCLENSGDSNEAVCIGYTTVATSGYWELFVNNNGSITSCKWTTNQTGTVYSNLADVVTVLWKDSDEYSGVQMDPDGGGLGGARICNVTKTGVTTFDTWKVYHGSDNSAISPISGIDFIRYTNSMVMPPMNAPTTQGTDIAPYGQYDPDNEAADLGTSGWREEWTGDTASETWAWSNQDSATETIGDDAAYVEGDGTDQLHMRCTTNVATNADQTVTMAAWIGNMGANNNGVCVGVIDGGSVATPTSTESLCFRDAGDDSFVFFGDSNWNLGAVSVHGSSLSDWSAFEVELARWYWQLRYTDSSRAMTAWISVDGKKFIQVGSSTTLGADPIAWCYGVRDDGEAQVEWIQNRTDTNRDKAGE